MTDSITNLWAKADSSLQAKQPADAICYLAELVSASPLDRDARLRLAVTLGDAGNPAGALRIIRALAERLVHDGYMLPAILVIRQGLHHAGDDSRLLELLQRLHVRGVRAKAGNLVVPPPLRPKKQASAAVSAAELLTLSKEDRLARVAEIGSDFPSAGAAVVPQPMPLFCELDTSAFVATVKRLRYRRVAAGMPIIEEGAPGDSLLIIISGNVKISKGGTEVAEIGPGAVLGEMALITHAPRSASAVAASQVEYFELGRAEVGELANSEPKVLQELVGYCKSRLLLNLLRTSPLFSRFDEDTRIRLLGRFQTVTLEAGQRAIAQGQSSAGLFVIATGSVQVQVAGDTGDAVLVATLGPGEVFGEISLLKNQPATADVIAQNTVGAVVLPAADFQQVLQEYPEARHYLESLSADRLQASYLAVAESGFIDPDDVVVL